MAKPLADQDVLQDVSTTEVETSKGNNKRRVILGASLLCGIVAGALMIGAADDFGSNLAMYRSQVLAKIKADAVLKQRELVKAEHLAFISVGAAGPATRTALGKGETIAGAIARAGAPVQDAAAAAAAFSQVADARELRSGQPITVYLTSYTGDEALAGISLKTAADRTISVARDADGGYVARELAVATFPAYGHAKGKIEGSLYGSALAAGATDREVAEFADQLAFDVDFERDVLPGDSFEMVFERQVDRGGATVKTGDLLFMAFEPQQGKARRFYRFLEPDTGKVDFFDEAGYSIRRFLMATPINNARLTSGFGMRRHPIAGYNKMHKGVDFGAAVGTPVMAAGDGAVVEAGRKGGYGNYVRIRHANGYETAYGHLSRFGSGVRKGARVSQSQIIAFSGNTGASTGPHLHYEVIVKGQQINPQSAKLPTGRQRSGATLVAFRSERERIDAIRDGRIQSPAPMIASTGSDQLAFKGRL
ncbi:MAG: peptidoglycan DD-metalloendopeptidase family protein [Caulobacterales bacterium]